MYGATERENKIAGNLIPEDGISTFECGEWH